MRQRRPGRKYNRGPYWIMQRNAAFERAGDTCEVTGEPLGFYFPMNDGDPPEEPDWERWHWTRAAHHIIAERWVRRFLRGADPHMLENLVVITPSLHARLTGAENLLFNRTNWIGYRQRIHQLGFPLGILDRAFKALCASAP